MADLRVTCINKVPRDDTHHGITHLGGSGWYYTRRQVIDFIDRGVHTFHTFVNGRRADLAVVRDGVHDPYVRTHADGYWNDNLLALTECRLTA